MGTLQNYMNENISYWTRRAPGYSEVNKEELSTDQNLVWSKALDDRIQAHFAGRSREEISVLDVGTGPGFFSIILTRLGYHVTAADYTEAMLEQAKANAADVAHKITFLRMNAEELEFDDESFDVIVSRNVTWNLPAPQKAYTHWTRVLKPGGLMLNFDANWYRYLYDEEAEMSHLADREKVLKTGASDDTAGTDVEAMEAIARKTPLSKCTRPMWDLEVLNGLGVTAEADTDIWKQVWTEEEWINNASTPMFLVSAVKPSKMRAV